MTVDVRIYDSRFFKNTIEFEGPSAKAVVDILLQHFNPKSVIDIGAGCGIYLKEFFTSGVDILGYDGSPAAQENSLIGNDLKIHDLTKPLRLDRQFDLVLCIEVAEHLDKQFAETLVETLVNLGSLIIFTAATPGQGPVSIGHINEQPHDFWIDLFAQKGFRHDRTTSEEIKAEMEEKNVVWWVSKNIMIFKK
ncbi:class I SAM-dependent methyltransferase [Candidatus Falkowbacteria bacterium]|nr:class I SAM-dependent methyltransferase [Candidatus Falkowbacteria bacterium]